MIAEAAAKASLPTNYQAPTITELARQGTKSRFLFLNFLL